MCDKVLEKFLCLCLLESICDHMSHNVDMKNVYPKYRECDIKVLYQDILL